MQSDLDAALREKLTMARVSAVIVVLQVFVL
jgi:hypothetical protein